jgi:ATP synthase protein I
MGNPRDTEQPGGEAGSRSTTDDLAARIARAQGERVVHRPVADTGAGVSMASRGYRLAAEFVAAIIVGAGIGYGIDLAAGTRPWGMIVLLLVGFAAGVLNVVRAAAEMNKASAVPPGTPAVKDDDDE